MSRFTSFIKRERLYVLILILVTIVSILAMPGQSDKARRLAPHRVKAASALFEERSANDRQAVERALAENTYLASMVIIVSLLALVIFLLGIVIDCAILLPGRFRKPLDVTVHSNGNVSWTLWDAAKVVMLYLFFGYMLIIAETFLAKVFPAISGDNFRMIFNSSIMDILTVVFILYFTVDQYGERLDSLGLTLNSRNETAVKDFTLVIVPEISKPF